MKISKIAAAGLMAFAAATFAAYAQEADGADGAVAEEEAAGEDAAADGDGGFGGGEDALAEDDSFGDDGFSFGDDGGGFSFGDDDGGFGFDGFGDDAGGFGGGSAVTVSGEVSTDIRAYLDPDAADDGVSTFTDLKDIPLDGGADAKVGVAYSGTYADADLKLHFSQDVIRDYPGDVVDELTIRGRFGDNFTLEAGKMKVVWGKGDKLHVIDNFNADDYTDFIIPDYLDRRISTPMVRANYSFPLYGTVSNVNWEVVYTPFLPTDRFASSGRWVPGQVTSLTSGVTDLVSTNLAAKLANKDAKAQAYLKAAEEANKDTTKKQAAQNAFAEYTAAEKGYLEYLTYASSLSSDPAELYPDTSTLRYSQFGTRLTGSIGMVDLGLSYYYGHYKQPSVNRSKYLASLQSIRESNNTLITALTAAGKSQGEAIKAAVIQNYGTLALPELAYDRKQTFGLEAATILWHFNVRGELAYNLTADTAGDDPWVHNNSIGWLAGFDIDLPFWNANLNVQETGTFILHGDDVDDLTKQYAAYSAADVDYSANGYTNDKLVVNFSTSFMNDKLAPEVTFLWGIENADIVVQPKVAYKPFDGLTLTASGMYIWCKDSDSEFYAWHNNSFVNLGASIQF